MSGSSPDRKLAKMSLPRLDLNLNRLRRLELQIIESLGNETVNGKFSGGQPGSQPSPHHILEMKSATGSSPIPRS